MKSCFAKGLVGSTSFWQDAKKSIPYIYQSLSFDVKVFWNRDFENSGVVWDQVAADDAGKPLEKYIDKG